MICFFQPSIPLILVASKNIAHQPSLLGSKPTACEVELPILEGLRAKGVDRLDTLESKALLFPPAGNRDSKGNYIMSELGASFRRWCKQQRVEKPQCSWNLHLIGRGDNDSKNSYPVLDSNVKAAHTKPILFFLSSLATEIASKCGCHLPEAFLFWGTVLLAILTLGKMVPIFVYIYIYI